MAAIKKWSVERDEMLRRLHADDVSFALIADKITRETVGTAISRSACMGRAHRLGLPGRVAGSTPRHSLRRTPPARTSTQATGGAAAQITRNIIARRLHEEAPDLGAQVELCDGFRHLTLAELTDETCRWPQGNGPSYVFCGLTPHERFPYCRRHARIAYLPAPERAKGQTKTAHTSTGQFA